MHSVAQLRHWKPFNVLEFNTKKNLGMLDFYKGNKGSNSQQSESPVSPSTSYLDITIYEGLNYPLIQEASISADPYKDMPYKQCSASNDFLEKTHQPLWESYNRLPTLYMEGIFGETESRESRYLQFGTYLSTDETIHVQNGHYTRRANFNESFLEEGTVHIPGVSIISGRFNEFGDAIDSTSKFYNGNIEKGSRVHGQLDGIGTRYTPTETIYGNFSTGHLFTGTRCTKDNPFPWILYSTHCKKIENGTIPTFEEKTYYWDKNFNDPVTSHNVIMLQSGMELLAMIAIGATALGVTLLTIMSNVQKTRNRNRFYTKTKPLHHPQNTHKQQSSTTFGNTVKRPTPAPKPTSRMYSDTKPRYNPPQPMPSQPNSHHPLSSSYKPETPSNITTSNQPIRPVNTATPISNKTHLQPSLSISQPSSSSAVPPKVNLSAVIQNSQTAPTPSAGISKPETNTGNNKKREHSPVIDRDSDSEQESQTTQRKRVKQEDENHEI